MVFSKGLKPLTSVTHRHGWQVSLDNHPKDPKYAHIWHLVADHFFSLFFWWSAIYCSNILLFLSLGCIFVAHWSPQAAAPPFRPKRHSQDTKKRSGGTGFFGIQTCIYRWYPKMPISEHSFVYTKKPLMLASNPGNRLFLLVLVSKQIFWIKLSVSTLIFRAVEFYCVSKCMDLLWYTDIPFEWPGAEIIPATLVAFHDQRQRRMAA